jgi:hypothetical protein
MQNYEHVVLAVWSEQLCVRRDERVADFEGKDAWLPAQELKSSPWEFGWHSW